MLSSVQDSSSSTCVAAVVSLLLLSASPAQVNNDTCDQALSNGVFVVDGVNTGLSNLGATVSGVTASCVAGGGPGGPPQGYVDVWYAYIATSSCPITVDVNGSALLGPVLAAFDGNAFSGPGSCGSLPELGCIVAGAPIPTALQLTPTAGDVILFQVGSLFSPVQFGAITLTIRRAFSLDFSAPSGPGSVSMVNSCGTPNAPYFIALSLTPGSYPNGWFFGVDIGLPDLFTLFAAGAPFTGTLDANGGSAFSIGSGVPAGISVYAVTVELDPISSLPVIATNPVAFTTL